MPTGEGAARQEVVLDKPEGPLYAGGTVGVAALMRHEAEAETFGKGGHLGHRHHLASGAAQHHHMGVVDHGALRSTVEVTQGLGQKHLAVETLKARVHLEEQHAGVGQHGRGGLHFAALAVQLELVRGGVVLHLLARQELVTAHRHRRRLPDPMPAAEGGQRRVRQVHSAGPPVPPAPAPDSPCRYSATPGSAGGAVRLSPDATAPAPASSSSVGLCVPSAG